MIKGERTGTNIETLLNQDTPKEGVKVDLETAMALIKASSEDPRIISFLKTRTVLDFEAGAIEIWYRRQKSQDGIPAVSSVVVAGNLLGYSKKEQFIDQEVKGIYAWQNSGETNLWVGFLGTHLITNNTDEDFVQIDQRDFPKPIIDLKPEDMDAAVILQEDGDGYITHVRKGAIKQPNELATSMEASLKRSLFPRP